MKLIATILFLLICISSICQIKPLTVNDHVPDFVYEHIGKKISSDQRHLKEKLIIIDFFATWCTPCVKALGDLQKLQDKFNNKIQVITVSYEEQRKLSDFFKTKKRASNITLPVISEDTLLSKFFPYKTISHDVWIYNGTVKAITGSEYITQENIKMILEGKNNDWPVKDDFSAFNIEEPLFTLSNNIERLHRPAFYSGFCSYIKGAGGGYYSQPDSSAGVLRYNQFNQPVIVLYSLALNQFPELNNLKRCILQVRDTSRYFYNKKRDGYLDQWQKRNWYCYEAIHPLSATAEDFKNRLRDDLDFFFNLQSGIEKREIKCLVLRSISNDTINLNTKNGINELRLTDNKEGFSIRQRNQRLYDLVLMLNREDKFLNLPLVIDESNVTHLIDMDLEIGRDINNISAWRKALKQYGLDIIEERREMNVLIIREK